MLRMWMSKPVWMTRYWVSSWAISFALWVMPSRAYARDLRARIHEFRDDAVLRVVTARALAAAAETVEQK